MCLRDAIGRKTYYILNSVTSKTIDKIYQNELNRIFVMLIKHILNLLEANERNMETSWQSLKNIIH